MNVLDTLVTVVTLDSAQFVKGMNEVDSKTDKATKHLSDAEKASQKLSHQFSDLTGKVLAGAAAFLAVNKAVHGFTEATAQAVELKKLSDVTHESMESISAWGHAAVETGGSSKEFQSSLSNLHNGIQDLIMTGDSSLAPAMRFLGMNFLDASRKAKPLGDVLLDLSDKFHKMDQTKAMEVGKRLGLDQGTIFMLMKGRLATEELLKKKQEMGAMDAKNAEDALKFNVMMDESSTRMEHLYMTIGGAVLPVLNALLKGFGAIFDFFGEHKPFMFAFLAGLAVLLWNVAAPALAAAGSMLVMAAPFLAIIAMGTALAAVLALIVDDLWNFAEGNDSVIGDVIAGWESLKAWLFGIWDEITGAIATFWDGLRPPEWLMSILGGIGELFSKASSFVLSANAAPTNSQSTTSISGARTNVTNNNIRASANVNTAATDATGVSKAVGNTLGEQLRSAVSQHDDGVFA